MIEFIEGRIIEKNPAYIIINCNGIGYILNISVNTYSKLPDGENVKIYTHLVVREDAFSLFGFAEEPERHLFRQLISISGIGPNTARMLLSSLSPEEVYNAIINGNVSALQSVKGIGNKTAQRIIVDLKDKLEKTDITKDIYTPVRNTIRQEALSALVMLGFSKNIAEKTLDNVFKQGKSTDMTVEEIVKQALQNL